MGARVAENLGYYERRLQQERAAAAAAASEDTRQVHEELAELYGKMLVILKQAAGDPA